jgi:hypothetical protein
MQQSTSPARCLIWFTLVCSLVSSLVQYAARVLRQHSAGLVYFSMSRLWFSFSFFEKLKKIPAQLV